jgi:UDP-glucose:(heptosyl)LPS alpha-1,3-glucosyltransferase
MKLAIIRQQYRPDGGAERFISRALKTLSLNKEYSLSVITRDWKGAQQQNVKILECNPDYKGRQQREDSFAQAALQICRNEQFDIVQSHERIPGCDIYRAGDGVHKEWLKQRSRIMSPISRWFLNYSSYHQHVLATEKSLFEAPDLKMVICNSEMVKNEILHNFSIPAERLKVIYNGVDTNYFVPCDINQQAALRERLGLKNRLTFLYVGSGFERKGVAAAIKSLSVSGVDAQLVIVGKDKKQDKYKRLAVKCGVADKVVFAGVQKEPLPYFQAADALIHPALYDPFPNVVHEAMAAGLAILTSTKCGGAEFVRDGLCGYVNDALDIDAFARNITELDEVPQKLQEMKRQSRAYIESFTLERCITDYIELYSGLKPA